MGRVDHSAFQGKDRRMVEMDGAILRSLERFIGQLVQETWADLTRSLNGPSTPMDFSGIHRLGAPRLVPYLDQPGIFLVFGPLPEVRILHLGASQTSMHDSLNSRLIPGPEWSWEWRWETESSPVPTYAACAAMQDSWTLVPAMKTLLGRYIAPLQAACEDSGDSAFV